MSCILEPPLLVSARSQKHPAKGMSGSHRLMCVRLTPRWSRCFGRWGLAAECGMLKGGSSCLYPQPVSDLSSLLPSPQRHAPDAVNSAALL